jgi:hypothetical protein
LVKRKNFFESCVDVSMTSVFGVSLAVHAGLERVFDEDPRFGLVVLSRIACRAAVHHFQSALSCARKSLILPEDRHVSEISPISWNSTGSRKWVLNRRTRNHGRHLTAENHMETFRPGKPFRVGVSSKLTVPLNGNPAF